MRRSIRAAPRPLGWRRRVAATPDVAGGQWSVGAATHRRGADRCREATHGVRAPAGTAFANGPPTSWRESPVGLDWHRRCRAARRGDGAAATQEKPTMKKQESTACAIQPGTLAADHLAAVE